MAMKKAELEVHYANYKERLLRAKASLQEGDYSKALKTAISTLSYIDGMMQFERRYNKREFASIEAIDMILEHAPLLFDLQSVIDLEELLKGSRRIEKNTTDSLNERVSEARVMLWEAYRLWKLLEHQGEASLDSLQETLGTNGGHWRVVATAWETMGVVQRQHDTNSDRVTLATRMNASSLAKCPACGAIVRAAKAKFLREQSCPKCKAVNLFVVIETQPTTDSSQPGG